MSRQLKELAKLLKSLKENQERVLSPIIEENRDDIDELDEAVRSIHETIDVYFWVLVRANLENLFSGPVPGESEESYRSRIQQKLVDLQYEFLACQSLANFFSSL
jgi:hypothetical protein